MRTRSALTRRLTGALTVAALATGSTLAAGALSPATAATPIPTGIATGTVLAPDGTAVAGATVTLYKYDSVDDAYENFVADSTGFGGDYVIDHLPPGSYKARVEKVGFVTEFYNDAATLVAATPFTVSTGTTAVPSVSLAAAAATVIVDADTEITGVVTDAVTGKPLVETNVTAYHPTTGAALDSGYTDSIGRYELDGLDASTPVKLRFSDDSYGAQLGHRTLWSGGAATEATAALVTVTPGTPVTASAALTPYAGITGKVLNPAGAAPYSGWVTAYDADDDAVDEAYVRADGTYFLGDLNPGESYKVRFNDAYDYPGNDLDAKARYYFDVWYVEGNSAATAKPVKAGAAGTYTPNINATLRDTLVALDPPSITGSFVIGKTLTGHQGRWNRNGSSTFTFEWLSGSTVVGTASTYRLTAADAGKKVALRVTNTNLDDGEQRVLSATTAATVAKYASAVTASGKRVTKGKKAGAVKVTVAVRSGAQSAAKNTGTVGVYEGKKKVATVKLAKGRGTFLVTKVGKHSYRLKYSGNATTLADDGKVTVTVKKAKKKKK